jgi:hypothetical protein
MFRKASLISRLRIIAPILAIKISVRISSIVLYTSVEQSSRMTVFTERPRRVFGEERLCIRRNEPSGLGTRPKGEYTVVSRGEVVIRRRGRSLEIFTVITVGLVSDRS